MIFGIIKNTDNSYEYLYNIDNKIFPIHIDKNGIKKSDLNYIDNVLNMFKFNNECEYIGKFRDYDVFYDPKTSLKHFMKDKEEDYFLLLKYNGQNAILYKKEKDIEDKKKKEEKFLNCFIASGLCVILSLGAIAFLANTAYDMNANVSVVYAHKLSNIKNLYDETPLTYEEAIDYINKSNTTEEFKEVATNEAFLKLIFSYYENSALEYTARIKFENFELQPMDPQVDFYDKANGYYNITEPNVIYSRTDKIMVLMHEFIHLLQAEGSPYSYINEAVAELLSSELLDTNVTTYLDAVDNLKLLIDIIGPEPIYELSFGGDDTKLNEILDKYLQTKDIMTLKYYLTTPGLELNENEECHIEIKKVLYKLHKNMYGYDINENKDIMSLLTDNQVDLGENAITVDKRKYLNLFAMGDRETITVVSPDMEKLAENNLITKNICYKELIKILNPTYEMFLNDKDIEWKETYNNDEYIYGKIMNVGDKIYYKHLQTPIKISDYEFFTFRNLPSENYDIKEAIDKGYLSAYKVIYSQEKTNQNQEEYAYYISQDENIKIDTNSCDFSVNGIKTRFKDQYDNILNRINNESYHK